MRKLQLTDYRANPKVTVNNLQKVNLIPHLGDSRACLPKQWITTSHSQPNGSFLKLHTWLSA